MARPSTGDSEQAAHISGQYHSEDSVKARIQKFKMFFAGLIFATISFIGTHQIVTKIVLLKISETISLISLLLCGTILLIQSAEYSVKNLDSLCYLQRNIILLIYKRYLLCWILFILGMTLIIGNRSILLFMN